MRIIKTSTGIIIRICHFEQEKGVEAENKTVTPSCGRWWLPASCDQAFCITLYSGFGVPRGIHVGTSNGMRNHTKPPCVINVLMLFCVL